MPGLYKGMALPFGTTLSSYFDEKGDREILRTSIQMILMTRLFERPMLPGFGSPLKDAAFEPGDEILDERLRSIVEENVPFWDRRLEVLDVAVADEETGNAKRISVVYRDLAAPDSEDRFQFTVPSEVVTKVD